MSHSCSAGGVLNLRTVMLVVTCALKGFCSQVYVCLMPHSTGKML